MPWRATLGLLLSLAAVLATLLLGAAPSGARTVASGVIAFERTRHGWIDNDIYVVRLDGSGLRRLTSDRADDSFPTYSPDGSRIAYQRGPDGNAQLWLMNADGSNQHRLLMRYQVIDGRPAWSPDGQKLAFAASVPLRGGLHNGVYMMNIDGSGVRLVVSNAMDPAWSPDGRKLAFVSNDNIYLANADGSGRARLTNYVLQAGLNQPPQDPAWSPDGQTIAFAAGTGSGIGVYTINVSGTGMRLLTPRRPDWGASDDPAWLPDGRIAYDSDRTDYPNRAIWLMNADGSGQTRLTSNARWSAFPSASPKG